MPTYEYECACGEVTDRIVPLAERKTKVKCTKCGSMAAVKFPRPAAHCRYSYMDRVHGNPRVGRGKGR
jgi:putative FmdB family regulatory protein